MNPLSTRSARNRPLRIVHLGKYYPPAPGGMEAHVQTLARAQAALGASVRVVCVNHQPGPTRIERDAKVIVLRCRRWVSAAKIDLCPALFYHLRDLQVDVFHVHVPNPSMILACLFARPKTPVVVTYHSDHVRQRFRSRLFRPFEQRFYRNVLAILATSPHYAAGSTFLQAHVDRLRVLPHGIDARPFLEPRLEDRQEANRIRHHYQGPLWLACGRLTYYKGLIQAVRALRDVPGTLLIIGDGPEKARLEAEANRLGLDRRVVFLGSVPRVVPYYHAAYAFWFPSNARSEAFGLVQLEAMASGCPVINTDIPHSGVAWVSRHLETGLTVPMNDPVALADAALRLLTEPGLRDRLSAAARIRVVQEFDHRVMAERSLALYRNILTGEPIADLASLAA
jgi:glycosyltransferase involved in cell wall biosynthesis